jgi:tetratricopeptide (TPR) repeat protein/V8-like Glu-specific endopeptidase
VKFTAFLLGTTAALVCVVDTAIAQSPAEIKAVAQAVTVEIKLVKDRSVGSGILIHQQGNLYTIVTNRHVVCGEQRNCATPSPTETFQLKFGNGSSLKVPASAVKILSKDLDLATLQFRSNTPYQIAKLAPPGSLKVGEIVYTSGYPLEPRGYSFNIGSAIAVVNKRLTADRGGYTIVYDAQTQPGMSGGGVFDKKGRIVAIHGQGERFRENTELVDTSESSGIITARSEVNSKIGYNRGLPVRWVVESLAQQEIKLGDRDPVVPAPAAVNNTADEYFIAGFNQWVEPGSNVLAGKRQAIKLFTQAIRLNPRYKIAYFLRAVTYAQLREYRLAISDYNQVINLDPQNATGYSHRGLFKDEKLNDPNGALADYNQAISLNPQDALAYYNRGNLKARKFNAPNSALADYNQAISLNPQLTLAYINRGNLKDDKLNDPNGALADYNQAISLNPQDALAYYNRALLKDDKFNDPNGALADYNQAISLNPQDAPAYINRGNLKAHKFNAPNGALADYNQAISLNPQFATAYTNRGTLKARKFNAPNGALADYNQAISLAPNNPNAYGGRGYLKYTQLNDRSGGIADTKKAAELAKAQGNSQVLSVALKLLQSWGASEGAVGF